MPNKITKSTKTTAPRNALTLVDLLSRLTHAGALRLLGAEGKELLRAGGLFELEVDAVQVRIHVIYRRIDDDFIDPRAFRKESMLTGNGGCHPQLPVRQRLTGGALWPSAKTSASRSHRNRRLLP